MRTDARASIRPIAIAQGAMAIALVFVSFLLFRGAVNILNAFFVPLVLYFFSVGKKPWEILAVDCVLIFSCAFFFPMQDIFVVIYCLLAFALKVLNDVPVRLALACLLLTISVSITFWIGIILTDFFFGTRVNVIMIDLLNGSVFAYIILLLIEGALVGGSLLLLSRKLHQRICRLNDVVKSG